MYHKQTKKQAKRENVGEVSGIVYSCFFQFDSQI